MTSNIYCNNMSLGYDEDEVAANMSLNMRLCITKDMSQMLGSLPQCFFLNCYKRMLAC